MPKLNDRRPKTETIPTYVNLPVATRKGLESMINGQTIRTLTDAVCRCVDIATETQTPKKEKRR